MIRIIHQALRGLEKHWLRPLVAPLRKRRGRPSPHDESIEQVVVAGVRRELRHGISQSADWGSVTARWQHTVRQANSQDPAGQLRNLLQLRAAIRSGKTEAGGSIVKN